MKTFLASLSFFSRIPVLTNLEEKHFKKAVAYLPYVGILYGSIWAGSTLLFSHFFPHSFAIVAGLFIAVLFTGALHEDGFADCCDGFGASYKKESILRIMKDSSTGVFGASGLIFIFLSRYTLISSVLLPDLFYCILTASIISRLSPVFISLIIDYCHKEGSKSSDVSVKPSIDVVLIASSSLTVVYFMIGILHLAIVFSVTVIVLFLISYYLKKKIGGYTGDTLGASIIICEIIIISYFTIDKGF